MRPAISVAVVSICGAAHLRRCLTALGAQTGAEPFEVVVAYDPALAGIADVVRDFPAFRFSARAGERTPLQLAARALRESTGAVVLLTEDHCVPEPTWVRALSQEIREGRAAAGGMVDLMPDTASVDWAFYFVDFFRYADPVASGPSPTLTVCNVAYRRGDLEALDDRSWQTSFQETLVHDQLKRKFGTLYLTSAARVAMRRHVGLRDAIRERYAFGRLFGASRLKGLPNGFARFVHRAGAPLLPIVLLARMADKAMKSPRHRGPLVRALLPLTLLVFAWSWGEWLGYLTGQAPSQLTTAPELD